MRTAVLEADPGALVGSKRPSTKSRCHAGRFAAVGVRDGLGPAKRSAKNLGEPLGEHLADHMGEERRSQRGTPRVRSSSEFCIGPPPFCCSDRDLISRGVYSGEPQRAADDRGPPRIWVSLVRIIGWRVGATSWTLSGTSHATDALPDLKHGVCAGVGHGKTHLLAVLQQREATSRRRRQA